MMAIIFSTILATNVLITVLVSALLVTKESAWGVSKG